MTIRQSLLREASSRVPTAPASTLQEARNRGIKTAFLCHSHRDKELVLGFVTLLSDAGWQVYVDWKDVEMPERPNRATAAILKQKIVDTDFFLFLATQNSMTSRWCPWEIGYADGKRNIDTILICPTYDGMTTYGNEYLDLYRRIEIATSGLMGVWQPGDESHGISISSL